MATDDDIIIIDAEREYGDLARALLGTVIEISPHSPHHINPLELGDGYEDGESPIAVKSELITTILEQQMGGGPGDGQPQIYHRPLYRQCLPQLLPQPRESSRTPAHRLAE